jgi:hypothetical protein
MKNPAAALPANGAELYRRLKDFEAKLVGQKVCQSGALIRYVTDAGVKAGFPTDLSNWSGPAIPFAVEVVKEFDAKSRPTPRAEPQPTADDVFRLCEQLGEYDGGTSRVVVRVCGEFNAADLDSLTPDQLRQAAKRLTVRVAEARETANQEAIPY